MSQQQIRRGNTIRRGILRLGRRGYEAAPGNHKHLTDSGNIAASGSYSGNIRFFVDEGIVFGVGELTRTGATFNNVFHNTGVVVPVGYRPTQTRIFPGCKLFTTAGNYRYQLLTDGTIQIQESADPTGEILGFYWHWNI